ncbi:MAG: GNAT family N-acetyltransferase [Treponema sp.]|jgi:GNAT superfamily N-acetyltransferase|nr:GNAT family N-acetyltransferase [Treponema sp.]
MYFELTEALIHAILFSMEDQEGNFLLDTQQGVVVKVDSEGPEDLDPEEASDRYRELPEWNPAHGYRLMEGFTAGCKNPRIRTELTAALDRGKGVFRAFKDTLHRYPEVGKRWFSFKTQHMKQEIICWYNALREEWGLEHIGTEPEETDDLVLEDFIFRKPTPQDPAAAAALHRLILEEGGRTGGEGAFLQETSTVSGDLVLVAETVAGDLVGYIATTCIGETLYIRALEVKAEYRGLGIGAVLFSRLLDTLDYGALARVSIDLPVEAAGFSRVLLRKSFKPRLTRYGLSLKKSESYQHEHQETDKAQGYPDSDT